MKLTPFISGTERRAIKEALASVPLTDVQRDRLDQALALANDPSLMTKLIAALKDDGVPYSEAEIEVLVKVRRTRNDFVHGRSRTEPNDDDLDFGKGFVNRLLAFWARTERVMGVVAVQAED